MFNMFSKPDPRANEPSVFPQTNDLSFNTLTVNPKYVHDKVEDGTMEMNPPHQRGTIKTAKWYIDVFQDQATKGLVAPPIFHPVWVNGVKVLVSVDGKQRITAFLHAMNSVIPIFGKFYNEMSRVDRSRVENVEFTISVASRTLTSDELSEIFNRVQQQDNTRDGEFLNACLPSPIRDLVIKYTQNPLVVPLFKKIFDSNPNMLQRKEDMAIVVKCLYCLVHHTEDFYNPPSPGELREWFCDSSNDISQENRDKFTRIFATFLKWFANAKISHRGEHSVYLPFFLFFLHKQDELDTLLPVIENEMTKSLGSKKIFSFTMWKKLEWGNKNGGVWARYQTILDKCN